MLLKVKDSLIGISNLTVYADAPFSSDLHKRIKNLPYTFSLIICALAAWGFFLTNEIIGVDALSGDRYSNGVLLGQNRLTGTIVSKFLSLGNGGNLDSYISNFIGIVLFMLGIAMICVVLERVYKPKSVVPLIIFSCLYITYPLMLEWFAFGGMLSSGICTALIAISLNMLSCKTGLLKGIIIPSLLLAAVLSSYEAFLLPFVTLTALILILAVRYKDEKQSVVFKTGIKFALSLMLGILIKINTGFIIQAFLDVETNYNADKASNWLFDGTMKTFVESFRIFFDSVLASWVAKSFCYGPITIISVFVLIGIIVFVAQFVKIKKPILILLYGILYLSVFAFTIYRCKLMACRMEQAFPAFIAAISYLILLGIYKPDKKKIYAFAVTAFALLTVVQCSCSSYWTHVEYNRFTEEKQVAVNIASDIRSNYGISKPVVFIGKYNLSEKITNNSIMKENSVPRKIYDKMNERFSEVSADGNYKIPDTLARSYLAWGVTAFGEAGTENYKFFNYINCPLTPCTDAQYEDALKNHSDIPGYPNKGYIFDAGDYLVVNLG
ncbi:MAG: glucosyltransferase domain-containing protein [Clostridiales bacterium]|nr:glucosyltransferase domain-containing protein [Clostridiales bacterium]